MNKRVIYPLLALAAAAVVAALLIVSKPAPVGEDYIPPPTTVRTVRVQKRAEYLTVRSQGTVEPRTQSQLIPEVSGRVVWMAPALVAGGAFEEGDTLLRIDPADYQNSVERSGALLTRAKVEREHARDELDRLKTLHSQNLASQSQLDEAERRYLVADANFTESNINLQQAQRDLSRTEITAPYRGRVRNEQVDLGQFVSRGSSMATIYANDYAEIRLPIAPNQITYLDISITGQLQADPPAPVSVSSDFGRIKFIWNGELVRLEAEIDSRSRMIYGVARIRNEDFADSPPLSVGLFVQAEIQGRLVQDVIRLPRSAMRDANQVLVVNADNRLSFRQVSVLRVEHDEVLISKGLEDGERVCISPLQTVVEGMRVQAVEA
ncbi:MAG: efflux RND transporter periplasmic adaptor subunit [Gammaproteobacteria bacterium]|nr:efflux RND transporter periplasmic adaptor subunit [Gammaproteobacteria bacterium]